MNIYIDFEANGVSQFQEIISIGAITENGEKFYTLVRPHSLLDKKIKELTHISQALANAAPTLEEVMDAFREWVCSVSHGTKVKFLVYGSSDRDFVKNSMSQTNNEETLEIMTFLHNRIENVEKRVAIKFHRENIGLYSAYLTMRGMAYEDRGDCHNALYDAEILKYVWENIDSYKLPEGVEPVKVPKVDMRYGKKKSKTAQLTGSKKAKARQALRRCPEIASKRFNIKVRCTKGSRKPLIFNSLREALSLIPQSCDTAEEKLRQLELLYSGLKNNEPVCGWTLEEVN